MNICYNTFELGAIFNFQKKKKRKYHVIFDSSRTNLHINSEKVNENSTI